MSSDEVFSGDPVPHDMVLSDFGRPEGSGDRLDDWSYWVCSRCGWAAVSSRGDPPPSAVSIRDPGTPWRDFDGILDCDVALAARVVGS